MKYFVMLAGYGEMPAWDDMTEEEQQAAIARHLAFDDACAAHVAVEVVIGEAVGDGATATTLRTRGGEHEVSDGPFAESGAHIGGFYVLEAPDLDTVVDLCRELPGYDIDIRPVLDVA